MLNFKERTSSNIRCTYKGITSDAIITGDQKISGALGLDMEPLKGSILVVLFGVSVDAVSHRY